MIAPAHMAQGSSVTYKVHPGTLTEVARLIDCINTIERRVRERFPEIQWQFVEPDFEA